MSMQGRLALILAGRAERVRQGNGGSCPVELKLTDRRESGQGKGQAARSGHPASGAI